MEISLKFRVERKGDPTVLSNRRVRLCDPTFDVIRKTAAQWVCGEFQLQYEDDEGDMITMDSEGEWGECRQLWHDAARKASAIRTGPLAPLRLVILLPVLQRKADAPDTQSAQQQAKSPKRSPKKDKGSPKKTDAPHETGNAPREMVLRYLCYTHGADVLHRIQSGEITTADIGCQRWLNATSSDGKLNLDINQPVLGVCLMEDGLRVMDNDPSLAKRHFMMSAKFSQGGTALYNAACCEALLGNAEAALDLLRSSVSEGYNMASASEDTDLQLLHPMPEFKELLRRCRPRCDTEGCVRKASAGAKCKACVSRDKKAAKKCKKHTPAEAAEEAEQEPKEQQQPADVVPEVKAEEEEEPVQEQEAVAVREAVVDNTSLVPAEASTAFATPEETPQEPPQQDVVVEEVTDTPVETPVVPLFPEQMAILRSMGFGSQGARCEELLARHNGDVPLVVASLFE
eukprot:TRINITY_DN7798_c2_g2_i1.p1 TRINITY_DN7798_c2_g2~~TRINITY_DN7798_c2_g2_i1.p1  ORF type:complete len:507 (+),score=222.61 TRINITY_DN7798_c2_g2_i1:150-1523(+)